MTLVRILTVCGSLQSRSSNLTMLESLPALAGPDVDVRAFSALRELPHFDLDLNEGEPPVPVRAWREALAASDGVFIACPEYGHSLPGALKNAIDWVFASGELHRKPVVVTAASPSLERGRRGLGALCQTLGALEAVVLGGEPIARGPGADAAAARLLDQLVAAAHRVRVGQPALPDVTLPPSIEALVQGTSLHAPLLSRLDHGSQAGSPVRSIETCLTELAALLAASLAGAPLGGPAAVFARLDGLLDGDEAAMAQALLEDVATRVDASPALATLLGALGPRALASLG